MKMMLQNRYAIQLTRDPASLASALQLRALHFGAHDTDQFDALCTNVLITDSQTDKLVCTFRFMHLCSGREISQSYSAQFYNLENLHAFPDPVMEIGRFCIDPTNSDPNILRTAWAVITKYVDEHDIGFLYGCSSFQGTDIEPYKDAFALLKHRHLAPDEWRPMTKSSNSVSFANKNEKPNIRAATQQLPSLLRTYLTMGGWVSDHAVIDRELNTLHVFTGVEINAIPAARKRLLRANVA
jgi:putative hemolysin